MLSDFPKRISFSSPEGRDPARGDVSAAALAETGELAIHGVALRPGETAGAGRVAGVPVFLLPGAPAACLWAYELLAGQAVRRLAGHGAELPFAARQVRLARKIVSEVGTTDVCPVRCTRDGEVEPLAPFAEAGLAAAALGDGFVIVPEASEGYPQGAPVTVHLYPGRGRPLASPLVSKTTLGSEGSDPLTETTSSMTDTEAALSRLARQDQFLEVVSRDEATARFHRHLKLQPLGSERVPLSQALNRVLAEPVIADVDVPSFDRANVDGFAVRAGDTVGASERAPKALRLNAEGPHPGRRAPPRRRAGHRDADRHRRHAAARRRRGGHGGAHRGAARGRAHAGRDPPPGRRRASSSPSPAAISRAARRWCGRASS